VYQAGDQGKFFLLSGESLVVHESCKLKSVGDVFLVGLLQRVLEESQGHS